MEVDRVPRMFAFAAALLLSAAAPAEMAREEVFEDVGDYVAPTVGETMRLAAFNGSTVEVEVVSCSASRSGVVAYRGRVAGSSLNNVSIVVTEKGFVATVHDRSGGAVVRFQREGGTLRVSEETKSVRGRCGATKHVRRDEAKSMMARKVTEKPLTGDPLVDGAHFLRRGEVFTNVIDVMVGVDTSAAKWIRTKSAFAGMPNAVELFAADSIARCNNTYANTGLDRFFTFNLVHCAVLETDCSKKRDRYGYVDSASIVECLQGERTPASAKQAEMFAQFRSIRDSVGADIVSFLVSSGDDDPHGTIGISYALDDYSITMPEFADMAYNVCLVEAVANDNTMAHEIGHIMGAGHAEMTDRENSGPQLYDYSTGFYFSATNAQGGVFMHAATVMGYNSDGYDDYYKKNGRWGVPPADADNPQAWSYGLYTVTDFFSSPDYTYKYVGADGKEIDSGVPTGDAKHDNTRLLSLTYPIVANFRAGKAGYLVSFAANKGSGSMPLQKIDIGAAKALIPNLFTRKGWLFSCWNTKSDGSGTSYTDMAKVKNLSKKNGATVTLYAQWTPVEYTVEFDGNGATSGSMKAMARTYGDKKPLAANGFRKTRYKFAGWAKTKSGRAAYADGQVANLSSKNGATVTLYATWEPFAYKVAFDGNGATSGTMKRISMTADAAKVLPANSFARKGYTFQGWSMDKSAAKAMYVDGQRVRNLSDKDGATVTLYAVWKANRYTIRFDANGGAGSMNSVSATYGKKIALSANAFKRANFSFIGWSKDKDDSEARYADRQKVKNLTSADGRTVTLYAVWKRKTYTVKFDANGGDGDPRSQTVNCGEKTALDKNTYRREGFKFAGWATKKNGAVVYKNKAKVSDLAKSGKSITLYATWRPDDWAVGTYTGDGDIGGQKASVTLTVSSAGKISGKFVRAKDGRSYSFKSDGFDAFSGDALRAEASLKYGSRVCTLEIAVSLDDATGISEAEILVMHDGARFGWGFRSQD